MFRYSIALVTLLLSLIGNAAPDRTVQIVGGTPVGDDRYPWIAAVYFYSADRDLFLPGCGGTLIGARWILTAAHCVVDADTGELEVASNVAVLLGVRNLASDEGTLARVDQVIVHPDYEAVTFANDVALLELREASDATPIALSTAANPVPLVGETATVAGWGATEEDGPASATLLQADVPIAGHNRCWPPHRSSLDENQMVCAGGAIANRDACQGDSGGPLFVLRDNQPIQAGVVSFGNGCARQGEPGVYSRISSYQPWISGFVPDLEVFSGSSATVPAVPEFHQTLQSNTQLRDVIRSREAIAFRVNNASRAILTSESGDADLFVHNSRDFSASSLECVSQEVSPIDECPLGDTAWIQIFGYADVDSSYMLQIVDDSGAPFTDVQTQALLTLDTAQNDAVDAEGARIYQIPGGTEVTLTSQSGDADLYLFNDTEFSVDTLNCGATGNAGTHRCSAGGDQNYAMVYAEQGARFSIIASINNPTTPVQPQTVNNDDSGGGGGTLSLTCIVLGLIGLLPATLRRRKLSFRRAPNHH
jgi:secreted trypsin-like serine protease